MRMHVGSRLSSFHFRRRRRSRWPEWVLFLTLCGVLLAFLWNFGSRLTDAIADYSRNTAKAVSIQAINAVVTEEMQTEGLTYEDFVTLRESGGGQIVAAELNVIETNQLKSRLAEKIQNKIASIGEIPINFPIGNLTNNLFFSGKGPKIPIHLVSSGYATIQYKSEFSAAGINQTKHQIYLEVTSDIGVLLPLHSTSVTVSTTIPVADTVIVGTVPNTYTNIQGLGDDATSIGLLNESVKH